MTTAAAFDSAAATYDAEFSSTRLGQLVRERVWHVLGETFRPGERVLELGCGTGEDAVWLAQHGISVVATDQSNEMLRVAAAKAKRVGVDVELARVDANALDVEGTFDGVLADFGVLNCVADRRQLGQALGERVRSGGKLVLVVMGPVCAWEIGWYLAHGEVRRAFRRCRAGDFAKLGEAEVAVWYPAPNRLRAELRPWFVQRQLIALGTVLPPSYLSHLVDRWPRLFARLAGVDQKVPGGAWLADHYVAVFERR